MTITLGTYRRPVRSRRKTFVAATAFRRDWSRMSSTLPCWSTAPQLPLCAGDRDDHLIEVPVVARPQTTTAQLIRVPGPEPLAPARIVSIGHVDTTFEHQLRHVAEAQRQPVIQPHAMADDRTETATLDTTSLQRSRSSILPHLTFPAHQPDSAQETIVIGSPRLSPPESLGDLVQLLCSPSTSCGLITVSSATIVAKPLRIITSKKPAAVSRLVTPSS